MDKDYQKELEKVFALMIPKKKQLQNMLRNIETLESPTLCWDSPQNEFTSSLPKGTLVMQAPSYHEDVFACLKLLYPLVIPFAYKNWEHFRNKTWRKPEFYYEANIEDISKSITVISRGERFVTGFLHNVFIKEGPMIPILARLIAIIDQSKE